MMESPGATRARALELLALLLGMTAFWVLRVHYWSLFSEVPFSDMQDYENIALNVWKSWDFRHSAFWASYRPPGVPLLRAAVMAVFGRDEHLVAWQWVLAACTCASLGWLAYEIGRLTNRWWLAAGLVWVVALSKSSIFWSYKIAAEGPAEALLYASLASSFLAFRVRRAAAFLLAGGIYAAALQTRPNFLPIAILCPAILLVLELWQARRDGPGVRAGWREARVRYLAVALGLVLVWSPWLVRTYRLYGHVVPLTTHGPFAFFFALGRVNIRLADGSVLTTHVDDLYAEVPKRYPTDYAAGRYVAELGERWLADNWRWYLKVVGRRFVEGATDSSEYLTRVSRTALFSGALNALLVDKTPTLLLGGLGGLLVLALCWPVMALVPAVVLGPWLAAALICGYPRYVDPMLPLMLAGNIGWLVGLERVGKRVLGRRSIPAAADDRGSWLDRDAKLDEGRSGC